MLEEVFCLRVPTSSNHKRERIHRFEPVRGGGVMRIWLIIVMRSSTDIADRGV